MIKIRHLPELVLIGLLSVSIFYNIKVLQEIKLTGSPAVEAEAEAQAKVPETAPELNEEQSETELLHTLDEVNTRLAKLGDNADARALALSISEIDGWLINPTSYTSVKEAVDHQVEILRQKILKEVDVATQNALNAGNGKDAKKYLEEVGVLVSLYPMGESESIINQAKDLTEKHRNLSFKLEGLRRIRYNHWAVIQIEQALNGYHKNKSIWSPKKENAALVSSLVTCLGEIDPNLLEPTVLSLYNYVVDITKESISEKDKVDLAKKLTSQNIQRKMLDEF
ncbi:MAG: hypothetical protein WBC07_08230 [Methylotenera sp.]